MNDAFITHANSALFQYIRTLALAVISRTSKASINIRSITYQNFKIMRLPLYNADDVKKYWAGYIGR
jgi:hypothetical protein